MSIPIIFNGVGYDIPEFRDTDYANDLTNFFVAIPNGTLQPNSGTFNLLAELNFGSSFGIQVKQLAIGSTLDSSSLLSISSTTKGFLPPRMTTSQRDAIPSPSTGLVIYNTSTNLLNLYDGTLWLPVSTSAGGTITAGVAGQIGYYPTNGTTLSPLPNVSATGTGVITVPDIITGGPAVDVRFYGAVGDGITNDTAAINLALASNKPIYFPPGTYMTTGGHMLTNQHIQGAGKDLTIIKRLSGTNTLITISDAGRIEDITIDCNSLNGTGVTLTNQTFGSFFAGVIRAVRIRNAGAVVVPKTITNVTVANPAVITSTAHGFANGDMVMIKNVNGLKATANPDLSIVNNTFRINNVTPNTFEINQTTVGYTAYVSGGTAEIASYALTLEETGSQGGASRKIIEDLELHTNYGHIFIGNANGVDFTDITMKGFTTGYGIYISNLGSEQVAFNHCYLESTGIATHNYGIRDVRFNDITGYLPASPAWDRPFYFSHGFNDAFGSAGGEIAQIKFDGLSVTRQTNTPSLPILYTNNYQLTLTNVRIVETASTNWNAMKDSGTYNMHMQDFTVESTNTWNLFDTSVNAGQAISADNINYTQGVIGTASWSSTVLTGTTSTNSSVSHSNLNHEIQGPPGTARQYIFSHISGDIDLTNASATTILWDCSGTITDPTNAANFFVSNVGIVKAPSHLVTNTVNQLILGSVRTVTLNAPTPATTSRTWTIPDIAADGTFASLNGTQTFDGSKTFSQNLNITSASSSALNITVSNPGGVLGTNVQNTGTTAGSDARVHARVDSNTGGDAYSGYQCADSGGLIWSTGLDNSDNDNYKISQSSTPGTNDYLVINSSGQALFTDGTVSLPSMGFITDPDLGFYRIGANNAGFSAGNSKVLDLKQAGVDIRGTNTNNDAAAGDYGEFVSSTVSNVSLPASATFGEITSISLTAGDWDISLVAVFTRNGATYTSVLNEVFIGTAAGNNGTGSVTGSNYLLEDRADTTWLRHSFSVAPYRVSINSTTTYYLKVYTDTYTAGTPQASGRISARRVR